MENTVFYADDTYLYPFTFCPALLFGLHCAETSNSENHAVPFKMLTEFVPYYFDITDSSPALFRGHAHPPAVPGCSCCGRCRLWEGLSWHDLPAHDVRWIHGWRQRRVQCKPFPSFLFPFIFVRRVAAFCCCDFFFDGMPLANSQKDLPLLVRVTLAAPWCALERSTAWCHGVKDVRNLVTLGSMSRSASSSIGLTTSSKPTPEEVSRFLFTVTLTLPPPASSKTTSSSLSHWCHRQTHKTEQNKHVFVHTVSFYFSLHYI